MWDSKKETNEYELWKATHNCSINHIKSLSSMERAGVLNIFNRSVEKNSIIYHEYLGDGDSSSFKEVKNFQLEMAGFGSKMSYKTENHS